jgi:nifR3 family TIM-barrel protein
MNFSRFQLYLAPLAGVAETVFRTICRRSGADAVVSEMVSAEGLFYKSEPTAELTRFGPDERPIGIQLFGANPQRLAEAARWVDDQVHPDFIDLNAGCPVPKVVRKNGGAALLRDRETYVACVHALTKATRIPVSVKIRSGWDHDRYVDIEYARIAQEEGAAALILHPRTRSMGFSGHSLWERIAMVKEAVSIPVIGNGDVRAPEDAVSLLAQTGCDGIMIGRGAMGNPWLFAQVKDALAGKPVAPVSRDQRILLALEHLRLFCATWGERRAAAEMKTHLGWYLKGLPGAALVREKLFNTKTVREMELAMVEFAGHPQPPKNSNSAE